MVRVRHVVWVDDEFGTDDGLDVPWADEDTTVQFADEPVDRGSVFATDDRLAAIRFGSLGLSVLGDGGVSDAHALAFPSRFAARSIVAFTQTGVDGTTVEGVLNALAVRLREHGETAGGTGVARMLEVASNLLLRVEIPGDGPELFDLYVEAGRMLTPPEPAGADDPDEDVVVESRESRGRRFGRFRGR